MDVAGGLVHCKYCNTHQPVGYACCTIAKNEIAELKARVQILAKVNNELTDEAKADAIEKIANKWLLDESTEQSARQLIWEAKQLKGEE